jgi:hypothetical protein
MNKGAYDFNNLVKYCSEFNIELIKNYENIKVTRDTIIEGKCINHECNKIFNKKFRNLKKSKAYCDVCTSTNRKIKATNFFLNKYGVENPFQSEYIKEKIKQTNLEKYGVKYHTQSSIVKEKIKQTNLEKYGVEYHTQSSIVKEKIKKTNLEKYGVINPFQSEYIKEKIKKTNLKKYGVENPTYSKEIREQTKKKCLEKYGVEHTCKLNHFIQKCKEANLNKYNSEYPFQSKKYQEIFKAKCLERYGVENPSQNSEIADKKSKNSYKRKTYVLPSGKELICQGYEPFALDKLINEENIDENDIVTGCKNVPTIWYNDDNNKKHRHFVDIFIKSQNRCIEVKSTWTVEKKKDNIFLKQNAGKQLGYIYEIWVFNKKKEIIECYK